MGVFKNILTSRSQIDGDFIMALKDVLGFTPNELRYYYRAFTHRSANQKDQQGFEYNFERLEFLGDAVLGTVVADYLFNRFPKANEGYLTQMRSKLVSREHLNKLGRDFELSRFMKAELDPNRVGENIYGNLFEALVGAVYQDKGYDFCQKFIYQKIISTHVDIDKLDEKIISYKSCLIEWCQKEKIAIKFHTYEDTGKEAAKHFAVKLRISDKVVSKARSTSKKKAEEKAARRAYYALREKIENPE